MGDVLSDDEVEARLPAGWERSGDEIVRTFEFDEYMTGVAFAQAIAEIAETQNHHPRLVVDYGTVEVAFTSHEAGGITDADLQMAEYVDVEY